MRRYYFRDYSVRASSVALLASCLLLLACEGSEPSSSPYTGEWAGQYAGSNIDLVITEATSGTVAGSIEFSDDLNTGGCGSSTAPRPLQQGQYFRDSLVFGIPVAAGTTPTTIRGRVHYLDFRLKLKIDVDSEVTLTRC